MSAKLPAIPQNLLDKVIAYVAPRVAAQRGAARMQLALAGGYTGARVDRAQLSRWSPTAGSPESDVPSSDLATLRSRSRDQMRNAPIALGALNTATSHVVGTGLSYTPAIDAKFLGLTDEEAAEWQEDVKRRYDTWASSTDCDLARKLDFYGIQELGFRTFMESGDAIVLTPLVDRRPGSGSELALQLLEADRLSNPDRRPNTDTIVDGIEFSSTTGEDLAYHVTARHPGSAQGNNGWTRIPARGERTGRRNVLHVFKPLRPEQRRGIPWIAPILEPLKQLSRYTDAELNGAVANAIFAVFLKMDPKAFEDMFDDDDQKAIVDRATSWSGELESGKAVNLLPGEEPISHAPGRPNPQFDPFVTSIVTQIGIALELPREVLLMAFASSYSAARASLLMAWKFFRSRRDLLIKTLCQPALELWLENEVARGRIRAPGFFADPVIRAAWCKSQWIGDAPGSIDPDKEVKAAKGRVDLGISTLDAESVAYDGIPWRTKHEQRTREIAAQREAGIYVDPNGPPPAAPAPAPEPDPADDDKTVAALARISEALAQAVNRPINLAITNPPVAAGDVHFHPGAVAVEGSSTTLNMPEGMVQAPITMPPAPAPTVLVKGPTRQIHRRDPVTGDLIETINSYSDNEGQQA